MYQLLPTISLDKLPYKKKASSVSMATKPSSPSGGVGGGITFTGARQIKHDFSDSAPALTPRKGIFNILCSLPILFK